MVRQIQQCFHQGGAHTPALVVRMHKEAHRAHMAHPGIGADREAGAADYRAVVQNGHKVMVVRAQPGDERLAVGGAVGGEAERILKYARHAAQSCGPLRVLRPDGADGVVHKSTSQNYFCHDSTGRGKKQPPGGNFLRAVAEWLDRNQ